MNCDSAVCAETKKKLCAIIKWADRMQLLSDTSVAICLLFSHLFLTHAAMWLGEWGRIVFGPYLCLRFSSRSTSLHQMRACMFLLQYHSISLSYLRETTRNKDRLVEFVEKAQNVNNMAGSFMWVYGGYGCAYIQKLVFKQSLWQTIK